MRLPVRTAAVARRVSAARSGKSTAVAARTVADATPGQEIFHSADPGQPAGMVVNSASAPGAGGGTSLLAEVKLAALAEGTLHLDSVGGPLIAPSPMPYEVTTEAAD